MNINIKLMFQEGKINISCFERSKLLFSTSASDHIDYELPWGDDETTYQAEMSVNNENDLLIAFFGSRMIIFRFQVYHSEWKPYTGP